MSEKPRWLQIFEEIKEFLDRYDPERRFSFTGDLHEKFMKLREDFRTEYVMSYVGSELDKASEWVQQLCRRIEEVSELFGLPTVLLSKELKSFVENPLAHLKSKIFNYMYDLFRGKVTPEEFDRVASAAIRTSLRTNLRTVYQDWVFLTLLKLLGERGGKLVYPEHRALSLERHGKQKAGWIPPNAIIRFEDGRALSFFLEAPRPIGWEDTEDLVRAWKLYVALRPDMMLYSGEVHNIIQLDSDPPIKRPSVIIECKELDDWYVRVRYIRGPFAKPLTAEEWRSKWLRGLWDGLADVLGIQRSEVVKHVEEKKSLKLSDQQIVALYKSVYRPDRMFVISRARVPSFVKSNLENYGIIVIDDVMFDENKLEELADYLHREVAKVSTGRPVLEMDEELYDLVMRVWRELESKLGRRLSLSEALKYVLKSFLST